MGFDKTTYSLLKENREEGIKLLFEQYAQKLLAYSKYQWKTEPDTAWDIIYKTLYKVADSIKDYEFENEKKFASFIFKIFINYLRNHVRDTRTAMAGVTETELNDTIINNYAVKPSTATSNPALRILQEELEKLEDWQRILLLMRSQDVPYSEIVKLTGRPEDQLKVYYGRLKKQIGEKVNGQLFKLNTTENAK